MKNGVGDSVSRVRTVGMLVLAATLMALALTICAQPAWANGYSIKDFKGSVADVYVKGQLNSKGYADWSGNGKISAVKSSNTKVATVRLQSVPGQKYNALIVKYKKPGKATISYTLHGKKYKAKLAIYKYTNPLKSLKVGEKEFANKFKKKGYAQVEGTTGALVVKATPGWKVKRIEVLGNKGFKKVKNGTKLKKTNGYYPSVDVTLLQKKTKLEQLISLTMS